jgi:hypothetical protein
MHQVAMFTGITMAVMIGTIAVGPPAQAVTEIDLDARLSHSASFTHAVGFSEYERIGSQRDVEITVNNIPGLAGKRLKVYVNRQWVGTMLVRQAGYAHREWDTEHGKLVPFASAGDPVRVRTPSGRLVVSGFYHADRD